MEIDGFRHRARDRLDADVVLAWRIASLSRHRRRLPTLKSLLTRPKPLTPGERDRRQAEFDELVAEMGDSVDH